MGRMFSNILGSKQSNKRASQTIGDDLAFVFYLWLNDERIWGRRAFESQRLSHEAEHFEHAIRIGICNTNEFGQRMSRCSCEQRRQNLCVQRSPVHARIQRPSCVSAHASVNSYPFHSPMPSMGPTLARGNA